MSLLRFKIILFTSFFAVNAFAMDAPREVAAELETAKLVGTGELNFLTFDVYTGSLWSPTGSFNIDQPPYALCLNYERDFERTDLVERTIKEMNKLTGKSKDVLASNYTEILNQSFPDVKDGDRICAVRLAADRSRLFHNGSATGTVTEAGFADDFFGIWLASGTSEPGFRRQLLSGK